MAQNIHAHNPDNSTGNLEEKRYINGYSSAQQDNIESEYQNINGNGESNHQNLKTTIDNLENNDPAKSIGSAKISLKNQNQTLPDGTTKTKTASSQDARNNNGTNGTVGSINLPSVKATQDVISSNNHSSPETDTAKSYIQNGANLNLQHTNKNKNDDSTTNNETNLQKSPHNNDLSLSNQQDFYNDNNNSNKVENKQLSSVNNNDDNSQNSDVVASKNTNNDNNNNNNIRTNNSNSLNNNNNSSKTLINNIASDLSLASASASAKTINNIKQSSPVPKQPSIVNVYQFNLAQEFSKIRNLITKQKYNYVAMDTEFPGIAFNPENYTRDTDLRDRKYHDIKVNVDSLKIIQIGLSFFNKNGETPPDTTTWQFHFEFNQNKDMINEDSLQMLKKAGIDFEKLSTDGISTYEFAQFLTTSGLCLNKKISWLTYHSGFDFLYMMRLFSGLGFLNRILLYFIS